MRIGLSFREPLIGEAVACLVENRRGWSSAFISNSVTEALATITTHPVTVLLVDTLGIEASELEALLVLQESGECSVVLLAAEPDPGAYLDLPIDRVLPRKTTTEELLAVLGEFAPTGRGRQHSLPFDLSRRELECAQLVARGLSNRRIAELTGLREQSVKNVVSLAMRKLSVENRVQIGLRLSQIGVADALPIQAVVSLPVEEVSVAESVGA